MRKTTNQNILESIRSYLKTKVRYHNEFLPRPFFIEITGTPDAGKSTTIDKLYDALRREGFRVLCPQEGAQIVQDIPRTTPLYNLATGLYALDMVIHQSAAHNYDIVVFDRCIFDAYVWMEYWSEKGELDFMEKETYQNFFLSRFWTDKIDLVYFMVCDAETAVKRDMAVSFNKKLGESTNPESIRAKLELYRRVYERIAPLYPQLKFIDTTHIDRQEMIDKIIAKILDTLVKKAQKK